MWVLEVFCDMEKTQPLKIYLFATVNEVAYVLGMKPSVVYNYYHSLSSSSEAHMEINKNGQNKWNGQE